MFSSQPFSSLPFSDDGIAVPVHRLPILPVIYFNNKTLTFPLKINTVAEFDLNLNNILDFSLNRNTILEFTVRR
tara:strand:- start:354 stop:575 length:222 start_codon:yes stop_codon:yes gene_type:complete